MLPLIDQSAFQFTAIAIALLALFWLCSRLGIIARRTARAQRIDLVEAVDACLPQTQCGRCGYPGCRPYAEAIIAGDAINKCPPGGDAAIKALAGLLAAPAQELDTDHGRHIPRQLARIREAECIGCTKCIQACPVDAILGAGKQMHTVIESECTGCDLCVEPCPVDCIDMVKASASVPGLCAHQTSLVAMPAGSRG
ncbi:MAG: electron transport complex subunit RsxB [Pseudohongiellaceae bacterium]